MLPKHLHMIRPLDYFLIYNFKKKKISFSRKKNYGCILTAKPITKFIKIIDMSITKVTKSNFDIQWVWLFTKLSVKSYSPRTMVKTLGRNNHSYCHFLLPIQIFTWSAKICNVKLRFAENMKTNIFAHFATKMLL